MKAGLPQGQTHSKFRALLHGERRHETCHALPPMSVWLEIHPIRSSIPHSDRNPRPDLVRKALGMRDLGANCARPSREWRILLRRATQFKN